MRRLHPADVLRRLRNEDGIALIMAIGIVLVLAISSAAAIELVRSNEVSSGHERQVARALSVAEAGLEKGSQTVVGADPNATVSTGSTLGPSSYTLDGSSGQWSAAKNSDGTWTVSALAYSPNGTVQRRVQQKLKANTIVGTAIDPVYAWGFFMGDPSADCTTLSTGGNTIGNSAKVTVPIYIASSLCLSGGGSPLIAEPGTSIGTVPLYVGGKLRVEGNSSPVGTSTQPIQSATIVGGCQTYFKKKWKDVICSTPGVPTNGTGSGVWAQTYSSTPTAITKPTVGATEANAAYQTAAPGPKNPCGAGSTVGPLKFDSTGSTTRDTSLGTVRLLYLSGSWGSANNFDCRFYDGSGNLTGRLAWTFGQPGSLIVQGKIFIDGNLDFQGADQAVYSGSGTIYVNGTVTFANGARLCGTTMSGSSCSGNWDPATNSLEIVAVNAGNVDPGWNMGGDSQFEGIAFTNGRYVSGNSAWTEGPVIADSGDLSGDTKFKKINGTPPGAPGSSSTSSTTWGVLQGSWRQCPPAAPCPVVS